MPSSLVPSSRSLGNGLDLLEQSIHHVPVGYAAAVVFHARAPGLSFLLVLAGLAVVNRLAPAALSLTVGAGAFLSSLPQVVSIGFQLGYPVPILLATYGGVIATAAFVCAIGGGGRHRVARYLVVGTAAVELSLFALSPIGRVPDGASPATAIATVLVVVTLAAMRSNVGYYSMATFLLVTQFVLAVAPSPYGHNGPHVFTGTMVFALLSAILARR